MATRAARVLSLRVAVPMHVADCQRWGPGTREDHLPTPKGVPTESVSQRACEARGMWTVPSRTSSPAAPPPCCYATAANASFDANARA
ncbi:hypothetical protein GGF50DRAFT_121691 [Schizophyllum commune]